MASTPDRQALRRIALALGAAIAVGTAAPAAPSYADHEVGPATKAGIDRIAQPAFDALAARQRPDRRFDDPTGRLVGGAGLPSLAWVALRQVRRGSGDAASRLAVARGTLAAGSAAASCSGGHWR